MFRICNRHADFEDSAQENWVLDKDLNALCVERLGFRDNTALILDFIRAGNQLVARRDGYTGDSDDSIVGDYFEEISTDLDNLHNVQERINSVVDSKLSPTFPQADSEPASLNKGDDVQAGGKAVENLDEDAK